MSFLIDYDKQPLKFLKNQDKHMSKRIMERIDDIFKERTVPHVATSIVGEHGVYRIRIGDFRALYRINYQEKKIIIFKIDKRSRAYD